MFSWRGSQLPFARAYVGRCVSRQLTSGSGPFRHIRLPPETSPRVADLRLPSPWNMLVTYWLEDGAFTLSPVRDGPVVLKATQLNRFRLSTCFGH
jgi:hypothetical protein